MVSPAEMVTLQLAEPGGRFTQQLYVAAESEVALPGGREHWPEDVRVDGASAALFERDGRPTLRLAAGTHRVTGRFAWRALPPLLAIPPETGVVSLRVAGEAVPFPKRDRRGRLWLREADDGTSRRVAEDHLEVEVHRRVLDTIPLQLETRGVASTAAGHPVGAGAAQAHVVGHWAQQSLVRRLPVDSEWLSP